ncbi:MAG: TIGR03668 family PPOX class F420-dependent oxidoreductase [Chloroflexota bacterium]|nr:TIGR03668 family PPOX class F420-dependent oxidoreductase [Chloroflexota bacterium]
MVALDEQVRAFLDAQRVAHLATADASGMPHVVPICFSLVGETLYVAIDEKPKRGDPMRLRRLRNLAENPRVAIVADVYDDTHWSRLGFVLVRGIARVLIEGPEHARAVSALQDKYVQYRGMALEQRPVIAAEIDRVTAWGQLS